MNGNDDTEIMKPLEQLACMLRWDQDNWTDEYKERYLRLAIEQVLSERHAEVSTDTGGEA